MNRVNIDSSEIIIIEITIHFRALLTQKNVIVFYLLILSSHTIREIWLYTSNRCIWVRKYLKRMCTLYISWFHDLYSFFSDYYNQLGSTLLAGCRLIKSYDMWFPVFSVVTDVKLVSDKIDIQLLYDHRSLDIFLYVMSWCRFERRLSPCAVSLRAIYPAHRNF